MLLILLCLIFGSHTASEAQCANCLWNGAPFSCGSIAWFTSHYHACCNGAWCTCTGRYPNGPCGCCGMLNKNKNIVNETILNSNYFSTVDRRLYTEYVTLAKIDNEIYTKDKTVHSSKLKLTDLILWPGFDIDSTLSVTENVVMEIGSYNVSANNYKCCGSIEVGFPPSCHVKFCCGTGCCC